MQALFNTVVHAPTSPSHLRMHDVIPMEPTERTKMPNSLTASLPNLPNAHCGNGYDRAHAVDTHFDFSTHCHFRTITKTTYICTYQQCNKQFARIYDLHRHHRTIHQRQAQFPCRWPGCPRQAKAFGRKDKRDDHERKKHGNAIHRRASMQAPIQQSHLDVYAPVMETMIEDVSLGNAKQGWDNIFDFSLV
ncbi:hypothetical protein K491DRAFT_407247 [Lophiostoma macrostomum CBS 122681]|uniref:C2H2-type domain-containing protein n=1 Tax=Lophiostoma macrostomum CBS 122681 TaxID=1314788 RepID=A0A6A6T7X4_9PLEO|nr:hypothetical protein K491DRAFT_407247 [Lophiostoma macrostomum CBS 122681]